MVVNKAHIKRMVRILLRALLRGGGAGRISGEFFF